MPTIRQTAPRKKKLNKEKKEQKINTRSTLKLQTARRG